MIQQEQVMIAAIVRHGHIEPLKELLATMTDAPGHADPDNRLVPFGKLPTLHVARFVILDDPSLDDRLDFPVLPVFEPIRLAFIADCDGPAEELIETLAVEAHAGLSEIFGHCQGFDTDLPLAQWLLRHRVKPAARYTNWIGRSAQQVREEADLHHLLLKTRLEYPETSPEELWEILRTAGKDVELAALPRKTMSQWISNAGHFFLLPLLAILLAPFVILLLPVLIVMLRRREKTDPVIAPQPSRKRNNMLSSIEDHDVANQYSAIGSLKPGLFRRWLTIVILWVINWGARHILNRGRLARVNTIHFASWTFFDDRRRVLFASNYDGSREAYNDDFINKVAFGLNLSFSNGLGYPRTDWLIARGARHEEHFKRYLFHHQIPTQVWYRAFPGLTTYDMARNARIRAGFESRPTGDALKRWIAEI